MLARTHLIISSFFIILFLPFISGISSKLILIFFGLFTTLLPDIDTGNSKIQQVYLARIVPYFTKHRHFFHSFTFCIAICILFSLFLPVLVLPFFIGYGLHIFADAFTVEGIRPFWPLRASTNGVISTGGMIEKYIFIIFVTLDIIFLGLFWNRFF